VEKQIKRIFILTITASLAMIAAQAYWLFNQYLYSLQQTENELFEKTLTVAEADRKLRSELKNKDLHVITRASAGGEQDSSTASKTNWNFEIYIINRKDATAGMPVSVRYDSLYIDSLYKSGTEIKKYRFEIAPSNRKQDIYDALDRFIINEKCPFYNFPAGFPACGAGTDSGRHTG
jgi:hypothetical protein